VVGIVQKGTKKTIQVQYRDSESVEEIKVSDVLKQRSAMKAVTIELTAMDSKGVTRTMACTRVDPHYYPKGATMEERGTTRYLGVLFSFAGWQEQETQIMKMAKAFFIETTMIRPSLQQLKQGVQAVLVARLAFPRQVMPSNSKCLNYVRTQVCKAISYVLGFHGEQYDLGESSLAAIAFTPEDMGLGLGFPDPEVAGITQDARRIFEGFESDDDRVAAATYALLGDAIDEEGKTVAQPEGARPSTVLSRIASLAGAGILIHAGGGGVLPKEQGITDRFLPEEIPHDPKCNAISLRLMEEAQISLVPTHVIFVPGETSGPPTQGEYDGMCITGYWDVFAAIGVACLEGKEAVWILQTTPHGEQESGKGTINFKILDLRTAEGRKEVGIKEASKMAELAMAKHEVHILGQVQTENYLMCEKGVGRAARRAGIDGEVGDGMSPDGGGSLGVGDRAEENERDGCGMSDRFDGVGKSDGAGDAGAAERTGRKCGVGEEVEADGSEFGERQDDVEGKRKAGRRSNHIEVKWPLIRWVRDETTDVECGVVFEESEEERSDEGKEAALEENDEDTGAGNGKEQEGQEASQRITRARSATIKGNEEAELSRKEEGLGEAQRDGEPEEGMEERGSEQSEKGTDYDERKVPFEFGATFEPREQDKTKKDFTTLAKSVRDY